MSSRLALLLLLSTLIACHGARDEGGPGAVALSLFALAELDEPTGEQLRELFDDELARRPPPALLDALEALAGVSDPRVVELQELSGPDETVCDLTADLDGGGEAGFSVRLEARTPGEWRITWFQGPGVEWPRQPGRRDQGLTVSAPPEDVAGR